MANILYNKLLQIKTVYIQTSVFVKFPSELIVVLAD